jgi:hypothetical protein
MIGYTLAFTGKADKDEADIFKYITEKLEKYMRKISGQTSFSCAIFSPNSLLLAGLQKTMQQ